MENNHTNSPEVFLVKEQGKYTKKLGTIVSVRGTGISNLTSSLVQRVAHKAMYLRSDGYYEVFLIKVSPSGDVFGNWQPEREVYPSNEDFGISAWIFKKFEKAHKRFLEL